MHFLYTTHVHVTSQSLSRVTNTPTHQRSCLSALCPVCCSSFGITSVVSADNAHSTNDFLVRSSESCTTIFPPLNSISVGKRCTPNRSPNGSFCVTSTFPTFTFRSNATSSQMGANALQCPHHGAKNFTAQTS